MARAVTSIVAFLLLSAALHPALALGPADPFTPPGRNSHLVAAAALAKQPVEIGTLTGVRLGAKPAALIDGEWIALGHTVHGARLTGVRALDITLQHADGRVERLSLFPDTTPARQSEERSVVKKDLP
jgi:hypothetical protein